MQTQWSPAKEVAEILKDLDGISFEDQNVLVTGGAGFLGSWVCDALIASGANVVCADNLCSGRLENISHLKGCEAFFFLEHDITQPLSLEEGPDLVIHMASRASPFEFQQYPIQILKANTIGLMTSLGIARRYGSRLLYTSTSEVYGNPEVVPTPESYNGNVNPVGPRGCYDEAKRCGEAFAVAYRRQHGLDTRIARIFNTYGPRIRSDGIYARALPLFIDQAVGGREITVFGDGSQTRSFCYVTDQVTGLLRLAGLEHLGGSIVNIGNDRETSIIDMAKMVLKITGSSSKITFHPLPPDDPLRRRPDTSKAASLLGWRAKVELQEGIKRTIEWFISHNKINQV